MFARKNRTDCYDGFRFETVASILISVSVAVTVSAVVETFGVRGVDSCLRDVRAVCGVAILALSLASLAFCHGKKVFVGRYGYLCEAGWLALLSLSVSHWLQGGTLLAQSVSLLPFLLLSGVCALGGRSENRKRVCESNACFTEKPEQPVEKGVSEPVACEDNVRQKDGIGDVLNVLSGRGKVGLTMNADDLLFVGADGNYLKVCYMDGGSPVVSSLRASLKSAESILGRSGVVRISRGVLVNVSRVEKVEKEAGVTYVCLKDCEERLKLSPQYSEYFFKILGKTAASAKRRSVASKK